MAILKCKMCGGNIEVGENQNIGVCDSCGSTMTIPNVNDERILNLFDRANHFRLQNEFDKALAAYESILSEDNKNAEAHWGCVLSRYGIEYVEDPKTHKRVPTCHRVQSESVLSDLDYKAAVEYTDDISAKNLYQQEAEAIAEIQKNILSIANNEAPYDVFICYKETDNNGRRTIDSTLAQDIYYQLTNEGYKVFFSRITLEDKLGTEYEPYIFSALNSAKVMLVIGTSKDYFNAVWVKNEWARFLDLARKDKSKMIIPCYRDMDAYDLPDELSMFQSQDMSKIGFIQDLIRGIKKVLQKETPKNVTVVSNTAEAFNSEAILKRAFMLLEDAEWQKADELLEQVLNHEPENASAYVGKLMIDVKVNKEENLGKRAVDFSENPNYQKAVRFADNQLQEKLKSYNKGALAVIEQVNLNKAKQAEEKAIQLKQQQEQDTEYIRIIKENQKTILQHRIPFIISSLVMLGISGWTFIEYNSYFAKISDGIFILSFIMPFLCVSLLVWCCTIGWKYMQETNISKRKGNLSSAKVSSVEYKNKAVPQLKKWGTLLNILLAALLIVIISYLPIKYNNAVKLYENGDYEAAVTAFDKLDFYKDSYNMKESAEKNLEDIRNETNKQNIIKAGKIITMGSYNNHKLEWDVISEKNGKKLLLCRESFEDIPYDKTNYITTWEISNAREWCSRFYNNTFTSEEKSKISLSTLQNIDFNGDKGTTEDYVFVLSYDEANNYLSNLSEEARTNMAKTESDAFWLRTISNIRYPKYSDINSKISYPYIVWGEAYKIDGDNYYSIIRGHIRPSMWITE